MQSNMDFEYRERLLSNLGTFFCGSLYGRKLYLMFHLSSSVSRATFFSFVGTRGLVLQSTGEGLWRETGVKYCSVAFGEEDL